MTSLPHKLSQSNWLQRGFVIAAMVVLLAGLWGVMFLFEALFAESYLASYYCCMMASDLQKISVIEQSLSQFFTSSPGQELPALLFILVNSALLIHGLRNVNRPIRLLWVVLLLSVGYIAAELVFFSLSRSISYWVFGPQTTPYKGYYLNVYGIVTHAGLWILFWFSLIKAGRTQWRF
jgi:hypothetical protein